MSQLDRLRLRHLDEMLASIARAPGMTRRPAVGWVRTIRQALGMSVRQLAARAGVSATAARSVEVNEARGTVQLASLARLADAMDCDLVYALVPRDSLEATVDRQARLAAAKLVGRVSASMALEDQATSEAERQELVDGLVARLRETPGRIWDVR